MKKEKIIAFLIAAIMAGSADQEIVVERLKTTAYYEGEITASGTTPREGICAVNRERMGLVAHLYYDNDGEIGEYIGAFDCEDTGMGAWNEAAGMGAIEAGYVIDVYRETYDRCVEWMKDTQGIIWVRFAKKIKPKRS